LGRCSRSGGESASVYPARHFRVAHFDVVSETAGLVGMLAVTSSLVAGRSRITSMKATATIKATVATLGLAMVGAPKNRIITQLGGKGKVERPVIAVQPTGIRNSILSRHGSACVCCPGPHPLLGSRAASDCYPRSSRAKRAVVTTPICRKTNASKPQHHHYPGGRLGDGRCN
jgi:hypothetical protein